MVAKAPLLGRRHDHPVALGGGAEGSRGGNVG
jgi:hypothetical protein